MIHSIDTYIAREIENKLEIILSNRYIIDEILKDVQDDVADRFKKAYTGENRRNIPIIYTMPQEKQTQRGSIYIGLRQGKEQPSGVGNIQDVYSFEEESLEEETSTVTLSEDGNRLYLEVSKDIGYVVAVENLAFAENDERVVENNRIYFKYFGNETLEGTEFKIKYVSSKDDDKRGFKKGFMTTEHYSVLAVSHNMDVVRCLDLIIKAIFVLMRESTEEQNNVLLQNLQFGQIEEVPTGNTGGDGQPELLYGRETIVNYTVSYSLDIPFAHDIKNIEFSSDIKTD